MQYELKATIDPIIPLMANINVAPTKQGSDGVSDGTAIAIIHAYTPTPTITGREIVTEEA